MLLTSDLMASSMIMTLVIFFLPLFYSHLLHKPIVSTEICSSPDGQVKSSIGVRSKDLPFYLSK